ncbi:hypothetical protein OIO90_000385 [Microbotryomycetes sp. JL221]|nr:hypothetical protein OIO90_000385 [Microbotryomycetes sp. JL221]
MSHMERGKSDRFMDLDELQIRHRIKLHEMQEIASKSLERLPSTRDTILHTKDKQSEDRVLNETRTGWARKLINRFKHQNDHINKIRTMSTPSTSKQSLAIRYSETGNKTHRSSSQRALLPQSSHHHSNYNRSHSTAKSFKNRKTLEIESFDDDSFSLKGFSNLIHPHQRYPGHTRKRNLELTKDLRAAEQEIAWLRY